MKCPYCTGTHDAHDAACPQHPDKVEYVDLAAIGDSNYGFALRVRQVRALERIAQSPGGSRKRYAAECSHGNYQLGDGRKVLVLVSAYSVEDAVRQLDVKKSGIDKTSAYSIRSICPWDPRLHGPWVDSPSGLAEQDEKKIPHLPVTL